MARSRHHDRPPGCIIWHSGIVHVDEVAMRDKLIFVAFYVTFHIAVFLMGCVLQKLMPAALLTRNPPGIPPMPVYLMIIL